MNIPQYGSRPLYHPVGKVYLFGDVHNEADKLRQVLDQIEPLITPDDHIVFLGDLIDRGPHAARTIEMLVALAKKYPEQVFFVRGNHDWMLADYLVTGSHHWMTYLSVTLEDLKTQWNLPDILPLTVVNGLIAHDFDWITKRTIPYYETEELVGTHAPLDPTTVLIYGGYDYEEDYNDRINDPGFRHLLERIGNDIMWQFTEESSKVPWVRKFHVCGHQPGSFKHPRIFKDRAFIDTGCGKGNRPLTCMAYPGKQFWQSKR